MFCRLDIHLAECADGQRQRRQVQLLGTFQQLTTLRLVHVVDRDLLQDEGQDPLRACQQEMVVRKQLRHDFQRLLGKVFGLVKPARAVLVDVRSVGEFFIRQSDKKVYGAETIFSDLKVQFFFSTKELLMSKNSPTEPWSSGHVLMVVGSNPCKVFGMDIVHIYLL